MAISTLLYICQTENVDKRALLDTKRPNNYKEKNHCEKPRGTMKWSNSPPRGELLLEIKFFGFSLAFSGFLRLFYSLHLFLKFLRSLIVFSVFQCDSPLDSSGYVCDPI